uniref:alpha-2-macroglobulin n=1 Tax=Xanthobacter sp. KR7-225 TaxID=3156613 RepID=UPI0032B60CD2
MDLGRRLVRVGLAFTLIVASAAALAQTPPPRPPARPEAPPAAAPAPRPASAKTFQRPDLSANARRYERVLRRATAPLTQPLDKIRRDADVAFQRNDARAAAQLYGVVVVNSPDDALAWMRLARALAAIKPSEKENAFQLADDALAAAYISYRRARTAVQESEALSFIARIYAGRGTWRAAIDTMKAALDLNETAADRAFFEKMKDEHGFRMLDYTIEADLAVPRVCAQFSEDMKPGVDLAAFVQVEGMDKPAVTAEERQLCVEGLRHGEHYEVRVRPGIAAANGETTRKGAELSIYVRDRRPAARFAGRNYVLPSIGQKGIPVTTVNTKAVKVAILRIGDRGLVPTALDGEFRQGLEAYVRERLKEGAAIPVFDGVLEVDSPLNAEVTTAIPVTEALGKLESGVYVMTAAPDPAPRGGDDDYETLATQWFIVSDLGLTAVSARDGVHVMVRSLGSAEPVAGAEVRLVAKSNEVLGTRATDANGLARFDPGLAKGPAGLEPDVVVAKTPAGDYAFLSLKDQGFDLTDRGVAGREAPGPLDAFLATERGVYRSGESVHLTALLRDAKGNAAPGLPLTLILQRPDGVEDRRLVSEDAGAGGRVLDLPLLKGAMTGTWRIKAFSDPKAAPIGEATFLLEDYVPDRVEFELSTAATAVPRAGSVEVLLNGRYLFGAPAAALDVEAESELRLAPGGRKAFPGFQFGNADDEVLADRNPAADAPRTDANGRASLRIAAGTLPRTDRPLEIEAIVRLVEAGGRAVQRTLTIPVAPAGSQIGVKPLFDARVREGEPAPFEVVVAGADDKPRAATGLTWRLSRLETRYQWYKVDGAWQYEPVKIVTRVGEGRLDVAADAPARLQLPTDFGRYRLDVTGPGLPLTSLPFEAGYGGGVSADTPDRLELTLGADAYAAGDTLEATLTARAPGAATVMVMNEGVLATRALKVEKGANKVSFKVEPGWTPGAYVVAFYHRPLDVAAGRMPGRAIGLGWFSVDRAARTLGVELGGPAEVRPETALDIPLAITGLAPGEQAYVTLAAVDVGILNLTNFKPPNPDAAILGQRRLAPEIRDLYGALIDGMRANAGRLRSGGDGGEEHALASPPTQPPLALFSGLVSVGPDGKARISFPIPAFDGTARLMAIAWSAGKLGHATRDVLVRDKVVVLPTLPRFLANGDRGSIHLDVTNIAAPAGDYRLEVTGSGAVATPVPGPALKLAAGERQSVRLPVEGKAVGAGEVAVRLVGQGVEIRRIYAVNVRPAYPEIERRTVRTLAPGESLTLNSALVQDLVPGTGSVAVSAAPVSTIDVPALLSALDRYPYGCSEQITSRALPLLYFNELAQLTGKDQDPGADGRIGEAVARVLARQDSSGSFGLWAPGGEDTWLDAYVADFLGRAREKGFAVPDIAFRLALDRLRNIVNLSGAQLDSPSEGLAYALYVLARNGRAPLGDLRYIADTKLGDLSSPLAQGQVGAALALLGDRARAERAFKVALDGLPAAAAAPEPGRADFGSALRDAAALTVLAREADLPKLAEVALNRVDVARTLTTRTSTQENAWLLLAARTLAASASGMVIEANGVARRGPYGRTLSREELERGALTLRNAGPEPVKVVVSVNGAPAAPEPPAAHGFALERRYYTPDGKPADPAKATQNQRFVVVLKAKEDDTVLADVLLVDYLPAGFEIENPNLLSGQSDAFAWLGETSEAGHLEFRDDRFVASVTRQEDDGPFVVAYMVRAVAPGRYAHPPAVIEDMYRPDRFARTAAGTMEVAPAR